MANRINTELRLQVGQDGTLNDCYFDRDFTELLDTLDHASAGSFSLTAGEQNFALDFGDVTQARLVYVEGTGELDVTLGGIAGTVGTLLGSGGTFPTGFTGGETATFTVDGTTVAVTFTASASTAQDVVNECNAAAMLAGLAFVPFSVEGGQIRISGSDASASGAVAVTVANATIGFASTTSDAGTDPGGASAPLEIKRPAAVASAAGIKSYFLATVQTTSVIVTNASATDAVTGRYVVVGDLVT